MSGHYGKATGLQGPITLWSCSPGQVPAVRALVPRKAMLRRAGPWPQGSALATQGVLASRLRPPVTSALPSHPPTCPGEAGGAPGPQALHWSELNPRQTLMLDKRWPQPPRPSASGPC